MDQVHEVVRSGSGAFLKHHECYHRHHLLGLLNERPPLLRLHRETLLVLLNEQPPLLRLHREDLLVLLNERLRPLRLHREST
jgi:hypothetical protein